MASPAAKNKGVGSKNWEEAYLTMQQKYLQAQTELNRRNQEEKLQRVAEAKENHGASPRAALAKTPTSSRKPKSPPTTKVPDASTAQPSVETAVQPMPQNQTLFATFARAGVAPPDPSMVWGVDEALLTMTKSNALIQVNEKLREKIIELERVARDNQQDAVRMRRANDKLSSDFSTVLVERDHLLLQRETHASKLAAAQSAAQSSQEQLRELIASLETARHTLEQQTRELRSKLASSYDANDILAAENRRLSVDLKEATTSKERLLSRTASAEANDGAQREVNNALLLEMKNLNDQLAAERRRVLELSREVQSASERQRRIDELEVLLRDSRTEKLSLEKQNLQLLEDATRHQETAINVVKEAFQQDLETARTTAAHWENVCRLQFRDIQIRTRQHMQTQDEMMQVKAVRDAAEVQLINIRGELEAAQAKLDVVWPSHDNETEGLTASDIRQLFAARTPHAADAKATKPVRFSLLSAAAIESELQLLQASPDIVIAELRLANSALIAELETLKLSNDVLTSQLRASSTTTDIQRKELAKQSAKIRLRENARLQVVSKYEDRVQFLEAQVRSLRGTHVAETSFSATELDIDETIIELHVGQLLLDCGSSTSVAASQFWSRFPMVFATVDFLLHETITTDVVATSTTAFFGTTAAYRVKQDAMLLHTICRRQLLVELHVVTGAETFVTVGRGTANLGDLLKDPFSNRPSVSIHVDITNAEGNLLGKIEVTVTSRMPFTPTFTALCQVHAEKELSDESVSTVASTTLGPRNVGLFADESTFHHRNAFHSSSHSVRLENVRFIAIRIRDIAVDFSVVSTPLLTFWYTIPSASTDSADTWVLPPSATPRYEFTYNCFNRHAVRDLEGALTAVRNPIALVAFEDQESHPDVYWAMSSMNLAPLLDHPEATLDLRLPMVNPHDGKHLGFVRVEAAFEWE